MNVARAAALFVYGTLAPGRSNAFMLDPLDGTWRPATVRGRVYQVGWGGEMGYPGLILEPAAPVVEGLLFTSPDLPAHWARLDAFEGRDYRRVRTRVQCATGAVEAHVYVLREDGETVRLRPVVQSDLDAFFRHQQDAAATHMAAFTSSDPANRAAFDAHWRRIRADARVLLRTIVFQQQVVGHIASFEQEGRREVTYWLDRAVWGQGLATAALTTFLTLDPVRPLFAAAAADNRGSIRVLQKCGFQIVERTRGFASARGAEIDEILLCLPPVAAPS